MLGTLWKTASVITLLAGAVSAIDLDIKDEKSIKSAAHTAAYGAMSYYTGNLTGHIPGAFPSKWWEGSVLFDTMIHYWYLTGDDSNNPAVMQGMNWQSGDNNDYMTANYSSYIGNDDQSSWGLAAMTAAEFGFPQTSTEISWASKAAAVFNSQASRWDDSNCGGGLRWQIYTYETGYDIKNAMSNGELFELAARLARYTGNTTYSDWAEKIWDWSSSVPLLNNETWIISDSTDAENHCATSDKVQWSMNYGTYVTGAAYMYNLTNGVSKWKSGVDGLLNTSLTNFFPAQYGGDIMSEYECEEKEFCNNNEILFKGIFMRDLALISTVAPYTMDDILPRLQGSASAAAEACTGESNDTCGVRWYSKKYDGEKGMEQQLSAASVFTANLVAFDRNDLATQAGGTNATSATTNTTGTSASGTQAASSASGTSANGASVLVGGPLAITAAVLAGVMAIF